MIPLTLRIQNFLSYGSPTQTIDFSHYKLICLSGKNGHGKSALLDAITWALWGQARKIGNNAKADSGIVKLGQTDVMVIFDFIFNGQTYRVKRVFSTKYGKPKAHVDFGTYNKETDYFTPLTEKTIRHTQACIDKTLGLDYEAFINSSFLRQGQANEFSKKSPKERKEVLASILGLDRYEKAKKLALEKARTTAQEKEYLQKIEEHLSQACQQLPEVEKQCTLIATTLSQCMLQEAELQKKMIELSAKKNGITQKQQDKTLLLFEIEQKQKESTYSTDQFKALAAEWKRTHSYLLNMPDRSVLEKRKQELTHKVTTYQQLVEKSLTCKTKLLQHKQAEQELLLELKNRHISTLQEKKIELERLKTALALEQQKKEHLTKETTVLHAQQKACEYEIEQLKKTVNPARLIGDTKELQQSFERSKMYYQKWIEQGNWVANELKSLAGKQQLSQDTANPSCPLCEQNLSQARKRFLCKKFTDQQAFFEHRLERLKKLIHRTKEQLHEQHATLEASKKIDELLKKQNEFLPALHLKEQEIQTQEQHLTSIQSKYTQEAQRLAQEEEALAQTVLHNIAYLALKKEREATEKELSLLAIQEDAQTHLKKEQQELEEQLALHSQYETQKIQQEERKKQIHTLGLQVKTKKKEIVQLATRLTIFDPLEQEQKELEAQERLLAEQQRTVAQEKETALHQKGALENQQKKLQEQQAQLKTYQAQIKEHEAALHEYQAIAQALGKDGIQALLIEDALPEIEQEANELLSRLTDNQTHIFIESLRDLKKGGTKETLDINISDSSGIRPYEMFSGGEAFRLDFALRIAISKLLARRAGTSLQTLIIDEGFGSQDEEGLGKIMDVLYKIQDDFEKIIIVSHLAAMKDQFPVHFVISKGPQGSTVAIQEQD